jgi:hypothetical protein
MIDGHWKLIVPDPTNEPAEQLELYQLADDPAEESNLAAAQPKRVTQLTAMLNAWWNPAVTQANGEGNHQDTKHTK